ncbi:unnamed protein product [Somion occarium]|uniref:Uncharacterized protein n=1 Tax=Somion occarium TaxID=3059160 RepID=A0ABP1E2R9_9APHY
MQEISRQRQLYLLEPSLISQHPTPLRSIGLILNAPLPQLLTDAVLLLVNALLSTILVLCPRTPLVVIHPSLLSVPPSAPTAHQVHNALVPGEEENCRLLEENTRLARRTADTIERLKILQVRTTELGVQVRLLKDAHEPT